MGGEVASSISISPSRACMLVPLYHTEIRSLHDDALIPLLPGTQEQAPRRNIRCGQRTIHIGDTLAVHGGAALRREPPCLAPARHKTRADEEVRQENPRREIGCRD